MVHVFFYNYVPPVLDPPKNLYPLFPHKKFILAIAYLSYEEASSTYPVLSIANSISWPKPICPNNIVSTISSPKMFGFYALANGNTQGWMFQNAQLVYVSVGLSTICIYSRLCCNRWALRPSSMCLHVAILRTNQRIYKSSEGSKTNKTSTMWMVNHTKNKPEGKP